MDIRTLYTEQDGAPVVDWAFAAPQLQTDDGLETAVILSLFTDRLADPEDVLPDTSGNRRGWWGDTYADIQGDRIGSRLWLLHREKQRALVLARAQEYARESLQWLIADGIARSVEVGAEFIRAGVLALQVTVARATGAPLRFRFESFWSGSNAV